MKLKECSSSKLARMLNRKKLICFGTGSYLKNMLEANKMYSLENKIAFLLDNNPARVGTTIEYLGVKMKIQSPASIAELNLNNYVILIASSMHIEIFPQLQNICKNRKGTIYILSEYSYGFAGFLKKVFCKLPLKNYLLFRGESMTHENCEALGKYIASQNYFGKYKLIWACDHPNLFQNTSNEKYVFFPKFFQRGSFYEEIRYYWYASRARFIFYDNEKISKLRTDQMAIYLKHSAFPLKATKGIFGIEPEVNMTISPSEFCIKIISEQYCFDEKKVLICGAPRTDVFFDKKMNLAVNKVVKKTENKKLIIWVPTFRQHKNKVRNDSNKNFSFGIPIINEERQIEELNDFLEEKNVFLLIKMHHHQNLECIKVHNKKNIQLLTQAQLDDVFCNINDVMCLADAMITDYSSIPYDYMLLDRPIGYTIDDMEDYKLGFSVPNPLELMPGEKIKDFSDMKKYIENIANGQDLYKQERRKVSEKINKYVDGKSCERLCKLLYIG